MASVDKRTAIILAAEKLFAQRRFHEVTLDEVARRAHVGKGTIYLHFADKDDLFFQTATSGFDNLCNALHGLIHSVAPFTERLTGACVQISVFFEQRRPLLRLLNSDESGETWGTANLRKRWNDQREHLVTTMAELMEIGVKENRIRPDIPADTLALYFLGMLRTRGHHFEGRANENKRLELLVNLFLEGAGSTRP